MHASRLGLSVPFSLLAACSQRPALVIVQTQGLEGTDCTVPPAPTAQQRTSGALDVALPDLSARPYRLPLVVANNLNPGGGSAALAENDVTLTHFSVVLSARDVTWSSACPESPGDKVNITPFATTLNTDKWRGVRVSGVAEIHGRDEER
jgi:hypothetical protein